MPALHRAVALAEVDDITVCIPEHLKLDVTRPLEKFFHVHLVIAEGGARLGARDADGVEE